MTVLTLILRDAFVRSLHHPFIRNIHSRYESDRQHKKRKHNQILFPIPDQFFGNTLDQRVNCSLLHNAPLPLDIRCRDLVLIDVVVTYRSITKLDNVICHIPDGFVVRYHNDRVSVLLIDILNQL